MNIAMNIARKIEQQDDSITKATNYITNYNGLEVCVSYLKGGI